MSVKRKQRKVSVNGKVYDSMWVASKELGISYPTLQGRLHSKSEKFKDWHYADGKSAPRGRVAPRKVRPKLPGMYRFISKDTGKYYVGSTTDLPGRKAGHLFHLRKGSHPNVGFQEAWDESGGEEVWEFKGIVTNDLVQARKMEQQYFNENWGDCKMLNRSKDVSSPIHGIEGAANAPKISEEERIERKRKKKQHYESKKNLAGKDFRYGDGAPHAKPVIVNDVRYPSLAVACLELNIHATTMRTRCNSKSDKFVNYCWAYRGGSRGSMLPRLAEEGDYMPPGTIDGERAIRRPKSKGLILVTHTPTGKVYVAGSVNVYRILNEQEKKLARGKHDNRALQSLYDTQGSKVEVEVIEVEDDDCVLAAKQQMILQLGRACLNEHVFYSETA